MTYRVIKPYTTYCYGFPLTMPVDLEGEWFDQAKAYCFEAVDNYCPAVDKWPVEAWHDYFEKIEAQ